MVHDRCDGSLSSPTETRVEERRPQPRLPVALRVDRPARPVTIGNCGVCGAWVSVLSTGALHVHVDWSRRQARTATR